MSVSEKKSLAEMKNWFFFTSLWKKNVWEDFFEPWVQKKLISWKQKWHFYFCSIHMLLSFKA